MAELTGKAISELPAATTIGDSDIIALSQGGSSKKITPPVLLSGVSKVRDDIQTAPSSVDAIMSYLPGTYRVGIAGSQSIFPNGYGILEIIHAGVAYGLARFTKIDSAETISWTREWNRQNNTWYDSAWKADVVYPIPINKGGTGATSVSGAKSALGFVDSFRIQSILTDHTIDTTGTRQVSTYNGRKFSDYDLLLFLCGASNTNYRDSILLTSGNWKSGVTAYCVSNHGTNLASVSSVYFNYASDTAVNIGTDGAKAFNHCQIIGIGLQ